MGSLAATIQDDSKRRAVVDDCVQLIEAEVGSKGGISGIAIKAAYKTVKNLRPGMIPMAMNHLLDEFAAKIDPLWQECQTSGASPRTFFSSRKDQVADALLSITDQRRDHSDNRVMVGAYNQLRPRAVGYIGEATPRLADLIARHAS
jgi:hypothetical protein